MYDAIVIGAGPAGCAAAKLLAERGLRVLLMERCKLPRYKSCSGQLIAKTLRLVREYFGADVPEAATCAPAENRGMVLFDERGRELRFEQRGLNVWRSAFDGWLAQRAVESCAELRDGARVLSFEEEGSCVAVRIAGEKAPVRARWLIDGSGAVGGLRGKMIRGRDDAVSASSGDADEIGAMDVRSASRERADEIGVENVQSTSRGEASGIGTGDVQSASRERADKIGAKDAEGVSRGGMSGINADKALPRCERFIATRQTFSRGRMDLDPRYFYAFLQPELSGYDAWCNVKDDQLVLGVSGPMGEDLWSYHARFLDFLRREHGLHIDAELWTDRWVLPRIRPGCAVNLGAGRVLRAGEAAGFLNPMGEGISAALESGHLAAAAVLANFDDPASVLAEYEGSTAALRGYMQRQWSLISGMSKRFADMKR